MTSTEELLMEILKILANLDGVSRYDRVITADQLKLLFQEYSDARVKEALEQLVITNHKNNHPQMPMLSCPPCLKLEHIRITTPAPTTEEKK